MSIDKEAWLKEYRTLASQADRAFLRVKEMHGDLVRCEISCCDCCHAFFELTPVEAIHLNYQFHTCLGRQKRREILRRAWRVERRYQQIREDLRIAASLGGNHRDGAMDRASRERVVCPLLNEQNQCDLYAHRPITCRLYGIPTCIGGAARTCGRSGFVKGDSYPTANLDLIQERLVRLSERLPYGKGVNGWRRADGLISVSTALIATFSSISPGGKGEQS